MIPTQVPMVGSWTVRVIAVRPYAIHGDLYFELRVARTDAPVPAGSSLVMKVPQHAVAGGAEPQPGQVLAVTFLMGQVTGVRPAATET
jgi:hypothetical protein